MPESTHPKSPKVTKILGLFSDMTISELNHLLVEVNLEIRNRLNQDKTLPRSSTEKLDYDPHTT